MEETIILVHYGLRHGPILDRVFVLFSFLQILFRCQLSNHFIIESSLVVTKCEHYPIWNAHEYVRALVKQKKKRHVISVFFSL